MALNTVSSDRLSTNVKNTNFTSAEKQDLTDDIKPLLGSSGGGNKNLIINGAMQVAQRGTSTTTGTGGYYTIDRYLTSFNGTDEALTISQSDVASGTTPYTLGFRKALKFLNGNQTSGAGAGDFAQVQTRLEAQDIANSGWNYVSASSYVTLSFWVKSSVAQNFYVYFRTIDGTSQAYTIETGSLTADTWTKVTKQIPGNSNLQFDNNADQGLQIVFAPFWGTDLTASGVSLNTWGAYVSGSRTPDYTSTWWTTNDSTWELTGVQLEVGSVATDFEHRSFGDELAKCQRYYEMIGFSTGSGVQATVAFGMQYTTNGSFYGDIVYKQTMRAIPTLDSNNSTGDNETFELFSASNSNGIKFNSLDGITGQDTRALTVYKNSVSATGGDASYLRMEPDAGKTFGLSAEL